MAAQPTAPQAVGKNGVPWGLILLSILVVVLGAVRVVVAVFVIGMLIYARVQNATVQNATVQNATVQNGASTTSTEVKLNMLKSGVKTYQMFMDENPNDLQMLVDDPTEAKAIAKWKTLRQEKTCHFQFLTRLPRRLG